MTNGDKIRQMSDEELFDNYLLFTNCEDCPLNRGCKPYRNGKVEYQKCRERWLDWLGKGGKEA